MLCERSGRCHGYIVCDERREVLPSGAGTPISMDEVSTSCSYVLYFVHGTQRAEGQGLKVVTSEGKFGFRGRRQATGGENQGRAA